MNSYLFRRSLGTTSHESLQSAISSRLLRSLQDAQNIKFDGRDGSTATTLRPSGCASNEDTEVLRAHPTGVNSIVIDRFEGRL